MKKIGFITLILMLTAAIGLSVRGNSYDSEDGEYYSYNEDWLDSIPYLLEHARNRESWAYQNIARCYRYGIGVEKSMVNAMLYYSKSDVNENKLATDAYEADHTDEFGIMDHLLDNLYRQRMTIEEAMKLIEESPNPKPGWMVRMKTILDNRGADDIESFIESTIDLEADSADEIMVSLMCLEIIKPETGSLFSRPSSPEFLSRISLYANKIPTLYNVTGEKYLELYTDCTNDEDALKNAFKMFHKAYQHGLLEMTGAIAVLDYRDDNPLYEGFPFSQEELAHLDGLYSKELRQEFHEPAVEEEVVEIEEIP